MTVWARGCLMRLVFTEKDGKVLCVCIVSLSFTPAELK